MARITVDDCLKKVSNRFELVHIAAERSRQLDTGGHKSLLGESEDKATLVALREVAEGHVTKDILYNYNSDLTGVLDDGEDIGAAIKKLAQQELQDRKEREAEEQAEAEANEAKLSEKDNADEDKNPAENIITEAAIQEEMSEAAEESELAHQREEVEEQITSQEEKQQVEESADGEKDS